MVSPVPVCISVEVRRCSDGESEMSVTVEFRVQDWEFRKSKEMPSNERRGRIIEKC